ncbi:MAG TPA: hypothetical protein VMU83_08770, partial [Hanamia sp.]|nr:hypothetical protein [Hanamia sp.]
KNLDTLTRKGYKYVVVSRKKIKDYQPVKQGKETYLLTKSKKVIRLTVRSTMGDSMYVNGADGFTFAGLTDSLMKTWQLSRDSLSSVNIAMAVWTKNQLANNSDHFINVWYKEIDTYKTGKIDSANYEDGNAIKNGKLYGILRINKY